MAGTNQSDESSSPDSPKVNPADEEEYWRREYPSRPYAQESREFDDVLPAYRFGWEAAHSPRFIGRDFDDIEPDLGKEWEDDRGPAEAAWREIRDAARDAWSRIRGSRFGSTRRDLEEKLSESKMRNL